MIFKLKDGREVRVTENAYGDYDISDKDKQDELDYLIWRNAPIMGTYNPDKIDWFVIKCYVTDNIYPLEFDEVIVEEGEKIIEPKIDYSNVPHGIVY